MTIAYSWNNGLVFGIVHSQYKDINKGTGDMFEERVESAPVRPMVIVYLGPFQFIIAW